MPSKHASDGVPENTSAELWAWQQTQRRDLRLTPTAAQVLMALARRARFGGLHLWAGAGCQAGDTGRSLRAVKYARRELVQKGLIRVISNAQGGADAATIQLCIPTEWVAAERKRLRRKQVKKWADFGALAERIADAAKLPNSLEAETAPADATYCNTSTIPCADTANATHLLAGLPVQILHGPTRANSAPEQLKARDLNNLKRPLALALAEDLEEGTEQEGFESSEPELEEPEQAAAALPWGLVVSGTPEPPVPAAEPFAELPQGKDAGASTGPAREATKPKRDPIAGQIADIENALRQIRFALPDEHPMRQKAEADAARSIAELRAMQLPAIVASLDVKQQDQGAPVRPILGRWNPHPDTEHRIGGTA